MKTLETDKEREIFEQCTDTIIKHVGDIKNMVNAFSDFAKMPEPKMAMTDFSKLIRQSLSLQKQANAHIKFKDYIEDELKAGFKLECDEQQIRQSLINLIQNAVDALDEYMAEEELRDFEAKIGLIMHRDLERQRVIIGVVDNGPGIAPDLIDRVSEPYVTNKKKGTGLGLAIVKKIAEDHGGTLCFDYKDLFLDDSHPVIQSSMSYAGAQVFFTIPLHSDVD
jgi:two-component system nitrogen regulation sensor histidine kinase NtrY